MFPRNPLLRRRAFLMLDTICNSLVPKFSNSTSSGLVVPFRKKTNVGPTSTKRQEAPNSLISNFPERTGGAANLSQEELHQRAKLRGIPHSSHRKRLQIPRVQQSICEYDEKIGNATDQQITAYAAMDAMGAARTKQACVIQGAPAISGAMSTDERKRLLRIKANLPEPHTAMSARRETPPNEPVFDKATIANMRKPQLQTQAHLRGFPLSRDRQRLNKTELHEMARRSGTSPNQNERSTSKFPL